MIPHMTYTQYRTAQRLVHSCCNYDRGIVCCWTMGRNVFAFKAFPTR